MFFRSVFAVQYLYAADIKIKPIGITELHLKLSASSFGLSICIFAEAKVNVFSVSLGISISFGIA